MTQGRLSRTKQGVAPSDAAESPKVCVCMRVQCMHVFMQLCAPVCAGISPMFVCGGQWLTPVVFLGGSMPYFFPTVFP